VAYKNGETHILIFTITHSNRTIVLAAALHVDHHRAITQEHEYIHLLIFGIFKFLNFTNSYTIF